MHEGWSQFSFTKVSLYGQVIMAFYVHALGLPITLGLNFIFYLALRNHPEHSSFSPLRTILRGKMQLVLVPMMSCHDNLAVKGNFGAGKW